MTKITLTFLFCLTLLLSCSDFKQKAKPLFVDLVTLYGLSLEKCKTTQKVWSTAIFDKKYALSTSAKFDDYYVSDFDVAITRMEAEPTITELNRKINSLSYQVKENVEKISDTKNESYDKLLTLYTNVIELSKIAISPTGNLQSYANEINQKESQINMLITEIKARNPDYEKELTKEALRQKKEEEEVIQKIKKEKEDKQKEEDEAFEKSDEKAKQIKEVTDYLAKKNITATAAPAGEFVRFDNPGTGAQVAEGKYVTVKYTGKKLLSDSTFESSQFDYQVGAQSFIKGFEDGLRQFKQGGKGSIYIPGYLAYGASRDKPPFMKDHEPLVFDVEIIAVSDSMPTASGK